METLYERIKSVVIGSFYQGLANRFRKLTCHQYEGIPKSCPVSERVRNSVPAQLNNSSLFVESLAPSLVNFIP
jgi:hypothetical protein